MWTGLVRGVTMSEADDVAEWVRIMNDRYNFSRDLDVLTADAEALRREGCESAQWLLEWLHLHGKLAQLMKDFGNCLLYTSPSPRDRQKSRMPSSA